MQKNIFFDDQKLYVNDFNIAGSVYFLDNHAGKFVMAVLVLFIKAHDFGDQFDKIHRVHAAFRRQHPFFLNLSLLHQQTAHGGRYAGAFSQRLALGGHIEPVFFIFSVFFTGGHHRAAAPLPTEIRFFQDAFHGRLAEVDRPCGADDPPGPDRAGPKQALPARHRAIWHHCPGNPKQGVLNRYSVI